MQGRSHGAAKAMMQESQGIALLGPDVASILKGRCTSTTLSQRLEHAEQILLQGCLSSLDLWFRLSGLRLCLGPCSSRCSLRPHTRTATTCVSFPLRLTTGVTKRCSSDKLSWKISDHDLCLTQSLLEFSY